MHKLKTIKFDTVVERPATKYLSQADWKEHKNCITSNHSPYFLKLPNGAAAYHLIFQPELRNGKYPMFSKTKEDKTNWFSEGPDIECLVIQNS